MANKSLRVCLIIFLVVSLAKSQTSNIPSISVPSDSSLGRMVTGARHRGDSSLQASSSTIVHRKVGSLAEMLGDSWVVVATVRDFRTTVDVASSSLTTWDLLTIIKIVSKPSEPHSNATSHSLGLPIEASDLLKEGPIVFYSGGTAVVNGITITQESNSERLDVGKTYLLFLTPTGYDPNTFFFQFGGESVFGISQDGNLSPTKGYRFAQIDKELAELCGNNLAGLSRYAARLANQQKR